MGGVLASTAALPPGGGAFALPDLTLGIFLNDQPAHRLAVGGDRAAPTPLEARQGWIMPAGAEGLCLYDAPLDILTVSIRSDVLKEAGLADPSLIRPVAGEMDALLLALALQAEGFASGGSLYRETMERALAAHLVQAVAPADPVTAGIPDARLRRVVAHVRERLAEDLSLEELAAVAAMSPSHFTRAFGAATGASPLQFVIAERMERAGALLRTTRLPVAEIAWRVGYADLSRFARHFRRRFGTSPGAFRTG